MAWRRWSSPATGGVSSGESVLSRRPPGPGREPPDATWERDVSPEGRQVSRRRYRKLVIGGAVIALALAGLVLTGIRQSVVYFVTPSELRAATGAAAGKA